MSAAGCVIGPRPFVGAVQVRNAPHAVPDFYWLLDVGPPEAQIGDILYRKRTSHH